MGYREVDAAKGVLSGQATDFYEYVSGIHELHDLIDYLALHEEAIVSVRTWHEGGAFVAPDLQEEHDAARRAFTHYVFSANLTAEYLSTQLLARAFEPAMHRDKLPGPLTNMDQHERENLLVQCGVISDDDRSLLSRLRHVRNDFGHERAAILDLSTLDRPIATLNTAHRGVCILVEELYDESLKTIESVIVQNLQYPHTTALAEWSDGQVAQHYRRSYFGMLRKYGPLDEAAIDRLEAEIRLRAEEINLLEDELERRGYSPDTVLQRSIEPSPMEKNVTRDQPGGGSLVSVTDELIAEEAITGEPTDFEAEFTLNTETENPYTEIAATQIEWYGLLFVDGRVVGAYPVEDSGEIDPRQSNAEESLQIQISTVFDEAKEYTVKIGAQIEIDDKIVTGETHEQTLTAITECSPISVGDLLEEGSKFD